MQNPTDPLAGLRDIHLPEEVSWWPLAYGWWLLLAFTILLVVFVLRQYRRRRRSVRRFAQLELARLATEYGETQNAFELAIGLSELLRRVALVRFTRAEVASLFGEEWVEFLTSRVGGHHQSVFALLESAPYAPAEMVASKLDAQQAIAVTKEWIRRNAA